MTPKFPTVKPSFHTVLKQRVQQYFEESGRPHSGGLKILTKAIILVSLFFAIYTLLIVFNPPWYIGLPGCAILGLIISAIGFNVMHDGGHGSFSTNQKINVAAAYSLNILGGSAFMWNMKHNVIHHAYTNVHDVDDDLNAGFMLRLSEHQKKLGIHKVQHWYFWVLYSLLYVFWIFYSDYNKYFTGKIGDIPLKKMSVKDHIIFWASKLLNGAIFIAIPIIFCGWFNWLMGFITLTALSGFVLSIVFQLAHTVEHTHFPLPDGATGKMEDEWAVHQLKTTANFATRNKVISWFVGGLNFQVEHHLFPKISHIHYPAINRIVKQACAEYGVTYIEYRRMSTAVVSHVSYLKRLGRG